MKCEKLAIGRVDGIGQSLLDYKGQFNAFMGSSLNKGHFFTREHLGIYFRWVLEHCASFLFLIDDWEERNNYRVFKGLDEDTANTLAIQIGKERARSAERVAANFPSSDQARIHVVRTTELFQQPKCLTITSQLSKTFQNDPKFNNDVCAQVLTNIGGKLAAWRDATPVDIYTQGLPTVNKYLLEEMGVTIFVREDLGHPIEVYSSPPMRAMQNLYQGGYPDLSKILGLKAPYGYIQLGLD